jgi:hypothetical protein
MDMEQSKTIYSPFDNSKKYHYCPSCQTKYLMAFDLWLKVCEKNSSAKPLAEALIFGIE